MTAANMITLARIILIPAFMILATIPDEKTKLAAIIVFALASLTDGIDGYVARKYHQVTNFGKFIDPLADKLLVLSALLVLMLNGSLPIWAAMIILTREFTVTSLRMVAAAEGIVIQAAMWGKIKTFTQIICILILLFGWELRLGPGPLTLSSICIWLMTAVAVISGVDYIWSNFSVIKDGITQRGQKK